MPSSRLAIRSTPMFPAWGDAPYQTVTLSGEIRIRDLLSHLYVLIPVLDDQKHYWVSAPEIEKLLKRGEGWLPSHPERELIARRYLARQANLTREALRQLVVEEDGGSRCRRGRPRCRGGRRRGADQPPRPADRGGHGGPAGQRREARAGPRLW